MSRYMIKFSKAGYIKYTSHLDMVRLFVRLFNRANIYLEYSQGFNPHPKMSFGQPLSLGYSSCEELLEVETRADFEPEEIRETLSKLVPEGMAITCVERAEPSKRTIAAMTTAAVYEVEFPLKPDDERDYPDLAERFMSREEIVAEKLQRKSGKVTRQNIRPMIRELSVQSVDDKMIMTTTVDQGSASNLSPELVISAFIDFTGADFKRTDIEVTRKKIIY